MRKWVGEATIDLADRRRVVEHVAELAAQLRRRRTPWRPASASSSHDGEQQLDVDRRALATRAAREREDHRDRRLVVGAEDRRRCAFSQHALDAAPARSAPSSGTVSRCAHSRIDAARPSRRRACRAEQVARSPSRSRRRRVVLARPRAPSAAQLGGDALGARALVPRRALDRAQLGERSLQVARAPARAGAPSRLARVTAATRSPACGPRAASALAPPARARARARARRATNSRNSGAGRSGRDLNSGWYCEATKNGCVGQLDDLDEPLVGRGAASRRGPRASSRLRSRLLTS